MCVLQEAAMWRSSPTKWTLEKRLSPKWAPWTMWAIHPEEEMSRWGHEPQPDTRTLCLRPSESTELFVISQQTKEESVKQWTLVSYASYNFSHDSLSWIKKVALQHNSYRLIWRTTGESGFGTIPQKKQENIFFIHLCPKKAIKAIFGHNGLKHCHPPRKKILLQIQLHSLQWDPFTILCTVLILNRARVTTVVLYVSDRGHDLVMVISDWKQRSPAHLLGHIY